MLEAAVHRVMRVRGPNNVGETVKTDPTLLHFVSAIAIDSVSKQTKKDNAS